MVPPKRYLQHVFTRYVFAIFASLTCLTAGVVPSLAQTIDERVIAAHYPPLMIQTQNGGAGLAIDILDIAAIRLKRKNSLEFQPFQRALFTVAAGSNTLIPALFRTAEREKNYQWVVPIYAEKLGFITIGPTINTYEEARKLARIVVEQGSSSAQVLEAEGFNNLVYVTTTEASLQMLQSGRVQAWFQTEHVGQAVWGQFAFNGQLTIGKVLKSFDVYLVAGLEFPTDLARQYRSEIETMHSDDTIDALIKKYFASPS